MGRAGSFALALVAVFMLVLSGADHALDHEDERGGPAVQQVALASASPGEKQVVVLQATRSAPSASILGLHGCSGHCAAHAAYEPPLIAILSAPVAVRAAWSIDRGQVSPHHLTFGPERPPRT